MDLESRKRVEEDIIKSLKESSVGMIGIWGVGGVGKTTMARRIGKRVQEENLFEEVVMVIVGKQKDMIGIQEEIANRLRVEIDKRSMSARADILRERLMDKRRKIIILDDVWESLKLEDLGVQFESGFERCKIMLTSRSKNVCEKMEAQQIIAMEILTKEEAWILFKDKAGDCVEDSVFSPVAKDVVAECKGLPISLVIVGKALQNREKSIWIHSLSHLRGSNPTNFPEVLTDVYLPLKLSYDYLDSEREKLFFLLCCLFPEDYNISVEQLTWYSMGLQIFDDVNSIAEARTRTRRLVDKLKSFFLLMDAHEEYPFLRQGFYIQSDELHVKMHHFVRDVAIHIGSGEKVGFLKILEKASMDSPSEISSNVNCNWMSVDISNEGLEVPVRLHFPKLRLLMLLKLSSNEFFDISFKGMEDLNVLFSSCFPFGSTPPTLKNLRTLYLYSCTVDNISIIGELVGLEILSCYRCYNIKELPAGIGRLNHLRLLELCYCRRLKTIPFGVISRLVLLEELKIVHCFSRWEAGGNGKERRNASLTELESLPNLTCLQIEIDDWNLAAQDLCLSQNLVKFSILIAPDDYYFEERDYERVINLNLPIDIGAVGKWIETLIKNTEYLSLEGDGSNNFNIAASENLRNLRIWNCSTLKKLVETKDCKFGIVFPLLETLRLETLDDLEEICDGTITVNENVSLCNLKSIVIYDCPNLRSLLSVPMARCLSQLEVLHIESCYAIEEVFWNEITDYANASIEFPKLKTLSLLHLPNLAAFCQGLEIKFPKLTKMEIAELPKFNIESPHDNTTTFHFLCNRKVEIGGLKTLSLSGNLKDNIRNIWCRQIPTNFFNNLERLIINRFDDIRSLMSYSIAKNFVNLQFLSIRHCREMVEVIEGDDNEAGDIKCLFPSLKNLIIDRLCKLRKFWQWKQALELPLLEEVFIYRGLAMETFTLGSLNTPNIKSLTIDYKKIEDNKDLNRVIHQCCGTSSRDKDVDKKENNNKDKVVDKNKNQNQDEDKNVDQDEKENKNKDEDVDVAKDEEEEVDRDENKAKDMNVNKDEKENKNKDEDVDVAKDKEEDVDRDDNKDKDMNVNKDEKENKYKDQDEKENKHEDENENESRDKDKDVDKDENENENKDKDVDQDEDMDQDKNAEVDEEAWMMPYIMSGLRVRKSTRTRWTTWL